jgi:hypothetical protein
MGFAAQSRRLLKRVDRTFSGPLVEFSEQFLYGHREALCVYSGLPPKSIIKGSLEHGWTSFPSGSGITKFTGGKYLHLTWSSARQRIEGNDRKNITSVGAPFLYAYHLVQDQLETSANRNSDYSHKTLFFPGHGTEANTPDMIGQIRAVSARINPKLVTVCLFWTEFVNPGLRSLFKEHGFTITNVGYSGMSELAGVGMSSRVHAGSTMGSRHLYLLNLIALLNSHQNVIVGDVGTAAFYSAYMEKNLQLLPEWSNLPMEFTWLEEKVINRLDPGEAQQVKYIEDAMGSDYDKIDFSSEKFRRFAKLEIGFEDLKTPEELRALLSGHLLNVGNPIATKEFAENVESFSKKSINVL